MNESAKRTALAVAIDGPSGAGKSTVARILAEELHFIYVDTGALYRSVGYMALRSGLSPKDAPAVEALLPRLHMEIRYIDGAQRVFVNGEDVSDCIRTPEVSMAASAVSSLPAVRRFLFDLQRDMAKTDNVVMDGRDIGTVVLPDAQVKIFLTASAEVRAQRRFDELALKGEPVTYEEVLADMKKRDYDDSHRAAAPLKAAEDAVLVDTSAMDLRQAVEAIKAVVQKALAG
ncbi:MAG TPA: (d)CMP kinase [Firmicutes bacterium]|nr:(d)CMP kinase [Bacillota bacterium]